MRRVIAWVRGRVRPLAPDPSTLRRQVDLRIAADLFTSVRMHVEDFSQGEEAGFLICSLSRRLDRDVLLAREWMPVPDAAIERNTDGSVLSWSAEFNSTALERALDAGATLVLVHSHGRPNPRFSTDDRRKERPLFGAFSRLLGSLPTGTVILGDGDAMGSFWVAGTNDRELGRITVLGDTIERWHRTGDAPRPRPARPRLDRQSVAIGPASDAKLANATVAVVGVSGGGSHVVQQLVHQGVGTIVAVDDEQIDITNLGRVVGAIESDVDTTYKVEIAERIAAAVDSTITVVKVKHRFPSAEAIEALKGVDIIVACVDRFDARANINAFARRHMIPLIDIGLAIISRGDRLAVADGQIAVAIPSRPCLRCWLITDAVLEYEREHRPPGYDRNPDAPGDPQVVSMNGTLASEACNCVLDLITGYSDGRRANRFWQYDGRSGTLDAHEVPPANPSCSACAEEGLGDPAA